MLRVVGRLDGVTDLSRRFFMRYLVVVNIPEPYRARVARNKNKQMNKIA